MKRLFNVTLLASLVVCAAMVLASPANAQTVTTGSLGGTVEDQHSGRLPGATVVAVHTVTGTSYTAISQADGRFSILNVRVGTYAIKTTLSGFKDAELKEVIVSLGEERTLTFKLELSSISAEITITAEVTPINVTAAGTGGNISNAVKEALPTISRSITDIVRTNVYFNPMGHNEDTAIASVAGRSQRYNSLQIDGAVNNDLFGLAAGAGVPGGNAATQPISLDAIQEIQLVVSPYDVRQSGFSGGGINAITKTGTNSIRGTAFVFGRNQKWVGKGVSNVAVSKFSDYQTGFSLGGPIVRNRAFFFGTLDEQRRDTPSGFSVGGTGVPFAPGRDADVDRFLNILRTRYDYDIGPNAKDEFTRKQNNDKFFGRADFNIGQSQLTIRHNFVNAYSDNGFPSATSYTFPDGFYRFNSETNSTVGQLTTRFVSAVNEARVALTRVRERRDREFSSEPFPFVSVTIASNTTVAAALSGSSQANQLDQDILEVTDDYTRIMGSHQITLGTHNEFFKFRNLFINGFYGTWNFTSLDAFDQGLANGFTHGFSNTSDPLQPARFKVNHMTFYAGDQWRVRPRWTVTFGTRVDVTRFPDKPSANPVAVDNFGFATDVVPNNVLWSPRAGFNWDRKGTGREQIRGGFGMFAGRTPYVWISNQYGNTGVDFTRLSVTNSQVLIPFVPDPNTQPTSLPGVTPARNEIDMIHPDFKYPSIMRGNLAYDRQLPFGMFGTFEFLFSSTINDIRYENLNLRQTNTLQPDGRPIFSRNVVTTLNDVILITNTKEGSSWSIATEVRRPFANGFFVNVSYLYGESKTVMDGIRDQAVSQWGNVYVPGDPNHPPLTRSDYDPGHRFNLTASYDIRLGRGYTATASVFYSGQSGRPYTLLFGTPGVNGDQQNLNDTLYLPTATDAITYTNGTYSDLLLFMQREDCTAKQIGRIMERNSCRAPWLNTLDARFAVNLPVRRVRAEITLDILNMINLFDPKGGQFQYANFNDILAVTPTVANGVLTNYNLASITNPAFQRFVRSDLRSRWQMQLGGRVRF
ncbi:MAG TPA: carboxypeptidase regulatory-like domain-containing protein [Vicinamibacterales bacterium]|nr:carboxypeptidase regulatory-like domain-containing protein [Vicinamibacterales bacterium]